MKTTLLILTACFLFAKCANTPKKPQILEIYTNENIYFVDIAKLRVLNEVNDTIKAFNSFEDLKEYISEQTAHDVRVTHICEDPTHENCDGECECDGLGCHLSK